ncbi:hypothetical protein LYNGBM3L_11580 [Moorena producens 3L]|uniref:Uncharacterized protein n=1 Tax=Moorena producens 3L TaxID=489825 RepID=F4XKK9_9CYAN|nr:hypothetical protein LYNGBM3L_11580 [Moorena producens 3L]
MCSGEFKLVKKKRIKREKKAKKKFNKQSQLKL